jgi:hypothetical protein
MLNNEDDEDNREGKDEGRMREGGKRTYQAHRAYPTKLNTSPTKSAAKGRYSTPPLKSYPSGP